jgi:hypothetical protein
MFWVRWRKLWKINWLLRRRDKLNAKEEKFLREIREDLLTNRRKLRGISERCVARQNAFYAASRTKP